MRAHRLPPAAEASAHVFQDPVWSIAQPGRRWPLRVRVLARLQAPWLDLALASGADPSGSPQLERRAAQLLSHLNRVRVVGALVYCQGVAMASQIVGDGAGPLYVPRRRGELRERVGRVLAALRGAH
jgi:hypothetical protein